jgi:4-diphosphocytidyl-2-C-methyl-D-erythritol kinase
VPSDLPSRVRVPSFAKINLDLRILHKRPDLYHELRTIFQTVSLRDIITIEFEQSRRTVIELESSVEITTHIKDNLVVRAAQAVLDHLKLNARVRFALQKRIPMGAGMGGGSSNAAAVLLALPSLAGRRVNTENLLPMAAALGSDVPFFLYGGTALGLGRGTELYPLPELKATPAVVVASGIHVSSAQAYKALKRKRLFAVDNVGLGDVTDALTSRDDSPMLREFLTLAWGLSPESLRRLPFKNDFEEAVFARHPDLGRIVRKLRRLGAQPARMTGSGSVVFGLFETLAAAREARATFPGRQAQVVRLLPRRRYRQYWRQALGPAFAFCALG